MGTPQEGPRHCTFLHDKTRATLSRRDDLWIAPDHCAKKPAEKIIKAAHCLGHLGRTKTKQMLREKYWFPTMNSMVKQIIGQYYACQVTTKQHQQEPVKMSYQRNVGLSGSRFRRTVSQRSLQSCGHRQENQISRSTVQSTHSTVFRPTRRKLKTMFTTHGTPQRLESDNGPHSTPESSQNLRKKDSTTNVSHQNMPEPMARWKAS